MPDEKHRWPEISNYRRNKRNKSCKTPKYYTSVLNQYRIHFFDTLHIQGKKRGLRIRAQMKRIFAGLEKVKTGRPNKP